MNRRGPFVGGDVQVVNSSNRISAFCLAFVFCVESGFVPAADLTLQDAEQFALQNDPQIAQFQAMAAARMELATAADRLPDPVLTFGMMQLPISSFSLSAEPMTQAVVGVRQDFPPGEMRKQRRETELLGAEVDRALAMDRAMTVLRGLRNAWMEVYYTVQAGALIKESERVFEQLAKTSQFQYRSGRGQQQDVVQAQLELSLLRDRDIEIRQRQEQALAELSKWLGEIEGERTPSMLFPTLPMLPDFAQLRDSIDVHPAVAAAKARVATARKGVAVARAQYRPTWSLDVSYGMRSGEMSDLVTALVMMDLPFFTEKRQDKQLNARGHEVNAATDAVEVTKRDLRQLLDIEFAAWTRLGERLELYKNAVLPQSSQVAEASLKAYQSQVSEFSELIRARLTELESNLAALRLRVDRAKAHYNLLYIAGEAAS